MLFSEIFSLYNKNCEWASAVINWFQPIDELTDRTVFHNSSSWKPDYFASGQVSLCHWGQSSKCVYIKLADVQLEYKKSISGLHWKSGVSKLPLVALKRKMYLKCIDTHLMWTGIVGFHHDSMQPHPIQLNSDSVKERADALCNQCGSWWGEAVQVEVMCRVWWERGRSRHVL